MSDSATVTMPLQWLAACVASSQNVTLCHLWCIGLTKQSHSTIATAVAVHSTPITRNTTVAATIVVTVAKLEGHVYMAVTVILQRIMYMGEVWFLGLGGGAPAEIEFGTF